MAQRIYRFNLVSPKGQSLPNTTTDRLEFTPGIVSAITVEIPAGHAGKTGIAVSYGFNQIIPLGSTAYLRGNKKTIRYDFDDPFPNGDNWYAEHFNADKYDHTFRLAFEVDESADLSALLPPVLLLRQFGESFSGAGVTTDGSGTPVAPVPVPGPAKFT